jgi:hypothetical protein
MIGDYSGLDATRQAARVMADTGQFSKEAV